MVVEVWFHSILVLYTLIPVPDSVHMQCSSITFPDVHVQERLYSHKLYAWLYKMLAIKTYCVLFLTAELQAKDDYNYDMFTSEQTTR